MSQISSPIPLIDFSQFSTTPGQREEFLAQLRYAAREIGFFYLKNHGVDAQLLKDVQRVARQFFALPEEDKLAVAMINSSHFRGYNRAASEMTRGQPDWREQFDLGAERPKLPVTESTPAWARLQGPNQWPEALPELRPLLLRWQREMTAMSLRLLRAFALALKLPEEAFDPLYGEKPNEHIKLIRYPGRTPGAGNQGVGAHKDSGFLSFLLQDEQRGLQVEVEADQWVNVLPVPDTLVVNIGELLELATHGYLRATVHRVVSPPEGDERLSLAFFLGAQLDAVVPLFPLPAELAKEARGEASDPLNPLFRDVGFNYLKGRLRSHPDVAQRYYSDLLVANITG